MERLQEEVEMCFLNYQEKRGNTKKKRKKDEETKNCQSDSRQG